MFQGNSEFLEAGNIGTAWRNRFREEAEQRATITKGKADLDPDACSLEQQEKWD